MIHPKFKEAFEAYEMAFKQLEITKREAVEAEIALNKGLETLKRQNEEMNDLDLKQILLNNNIK